MNRRALAFSGLGSTLVLLALVACEPDAEIAEGNPETGGTATGGSNSSGGTASGGDPATGGAGESGGTGGTGSAANEELTRSNALYDSDPIVTPADYAAFVANTNEFGLDLFGELLSDTENVAFSPISTAYALSMTYAGARNNTATEMAAALHNDLPDDTFHAALNKLSLDLAARNIAPHETEHGTMSLRLDLLNAAWAQRGYTFVPNYLDTLSRNYDAGIHLLDYAQDPEGARLTINDWVARNTEQRIEELLPVGSVDTPTRLVLTNALYFYGTWAVPFLEDSITTESFTMLDGNTVTVPTMHDTAEWAYADGEGYQWLELPYDGNTVHFGILLPEAGHFADVQGNLTGDWLANVRSSTTSRQTKLSLPQFGFTWGTNSLKPSLEQLGIHDAFDVYAADFTGMEPTGELYISDVYHQAFIGVDEDGTEAAAATAVALWAGMSPEEPAEVTVDRPFLFFILDAGTDAVLFAGQVIDPTAQ